VLASGFWAYCAPVAYDRPAPTESKKAIREILSRREFRVDKPSEWFVNLQRRVAKAIDRFLERLFGGLKLGDYHGSSKAVRAVFFTLIGLILATVLVLLLRQIRFTRSGRRSARETEDRVKSQEMSARDLIKEATNHASRLDYGEAFRLTYLAVLIALGESDRIRYQKSRTNWEYVRALASSEDGELSGRLESATRTFDVTQYGARPCGAEDYSECLSLYREVVGEDRRAA
jgi:hypothetical protein